MGLTQGNGKVYPAQRMGLVFATEQDDVIIFVDF